MPGPDERFEDLLGGCARALAGDPGVALTFGVDERQFSPRAARLTRRPPQMSVRERSILRGQADLTGLYKALHDVVLHDHLAVLFQDQAAILAEAEQARIEVIGSRRFAGVAANLAVMLDERYVQAERIVAAADTAERRGLAIAALLRAQLAPALAPARRFVLVATWQYALSQPIGARALALRDALFDQRRFARLVLEIAASLPPLAPVLTGQPGTGAKRDDPRRDQSAGAIEEAMRSTGEATGLKVVNEEATGSEPLFGSAEKTDVPNLETDAAPQATREDDGTSQPVRRTISSAGASRDVYRVFTRAYDETIAAGTLMTRLGWQPATAADDPEGTDLRRAIARLAARLERRLLAWQARGWERDVEDGVLDPKRLSRAITSPTSRTYFMRSRTEMFRDTAVTLLLDNSASMRGRPLRLVALCVELLVRMLMRVGVRVEVLGFTTRSWRGGRSREAWMAAGSPPGPGRLNELLHIIYKPADAGLRQLTRDLRLMTLAGLPKENVDGEALDWAHRRLQRRAEQRRILIMISDGAPSDEGTLAVSNSVGNLLEAHLRRVATDIDLHSRIELLAIGIGYDVAKLYPRAIRIDDASQLSEVLMTQLYERLAPTCGSRRGATARVGRRD